MLRIITLVISTLLLSSCATAGLSVLEKYRESLILSSDQHRAEDIQNWLNILKADYRFSDIDYHAVDSNNFEPVKSINRASIMARAFSTPGHPFFQDQSIKQASLGIARLWLKLDLKSYNWWNNMIGVQTHLTPIVLTFWQDFSKVEKNKILEIYLRSDLKTPTGGKFTGQNLLWISDFFILRGLLFNRPEDVRVGAKEIRNLLRYSPYVDGFQKDGSFFQHGALMYSAGYGAIFTETMAKYFYLFDGTEFEFDSTAFDFFDHYVLDNQAKLTFGSWIDFQASGRNFTRKGFGPGAILSGLKYMLKTNSPRLAEYQALYDSLTRDHSLGESFNHYFFNADMMVHQRPRYYSSVRMFSPRTLNTDFPSNNEGLLSHNMSDGSLIFFTDNKEYKDIFSLWDFNKIPGTTADQTPLVPTKFIPGVESGKNMVTKGIREFVGGVSNGFIGVATMDFKKPLVTYNLTAKKTWIMLSEGILALGARISCPNCPGEVVTTVDQTRFDSKRFSQKSDKVSYNGKIAINLLNPNWKVERKMAEGNWQKINYSMPKETWMEEMLYISVSHGKKPVNSTYAYGLAQDENLANALRAWKIKNNQDVQVAWNNYRKIYAGAIHQNNISTLMDDLSIKSTHPITFIIESNNSGWTLLASDPTQKVKSAVVVIQTKGKQVNLIMNFPQGLDAGKTLEKNFSFQTP